MKKTITISITLLIALGALRVSAAPAQVDFHVSPDGNDANDGSAEKPFATPAAAQQAVRRLIAQGLTSNVTVLIHDGTYYLSASLTFGPQDSGTDKFTVTYVAAPGQQPVLSGGRVITGWKNGGKDKWSVELPGVKSGDWWFRQLFADGQRLIRARFPNADDLLRAASVSKDVKTIRFKQDLQCKNLAGKNAELVMYQNWSISRAAIVASDGQSVTTANPVGWIGHGDATTASPDKPAYLEHALEFLDRPGEWVLDRSTGTLTIMAAGKDPNQQQFVAPRLEQLVVVAGRKDAPVQNLHFKGLAFEHTEWPLPEFGYSGIQAGHHGTTMQQRTYVLPNAIQFTYARSCSVEKCLVTHTGAGGIGFGAGCRHNKVASCELADVGGNGVIVGWRGGSTELAGTGNEHLAADWKDPADAPLGNEVADCTVHTCGAVNHGCVGIADMFSAKTRIAHNLVHNLPYTGISIGFRWDESPTTQRGCILEFNHIHDVMKMLADGGGIYTLGLQPDTVLRGNLIYDVHRSRYAHGGAPNNGIFFDQGSKGYLVEGNVIYATSGEPIRFNQCGEKSLIWKDNSFGPKPGEPNFPESAARKAGPRS